jgi:GntR family transcriptional regulator
MDVDIRSSLAAGIGTAQPLYKEVKLRITRALMAGEWRPGQAIPSESRLAVRFQVSLGTVRKAIDELVAEKIVVRQQGRGTFIATHTPDRTLFYFFHIVGKDGRKDTPATQLLAFERERADADRAQKLAIGRGEGIYCIRNLLRLSGQPVVIDDIAIAAQRFPDLDETTFGNRDGTIYALYQERYGINVIRIAERLSATLADQSSARLLALPIRTPLLRIERIAYTYHDRPVELRVSLVNTAAHEYMNDLVKA